MRAPSAAIMLRRPGQHSLFWKQPDRPDAVRFQVKKKGRAGYGFLTAGEFLKYQTRGLWLLWVSLFMEHCFPNPGPGN